MLRGPGVQLARHPHCHLPSAGQYECAVYAVQAFRGVLHTVSQRYTVTCVMSSADVSLSAQRQGRDVRLTWAVNVADSLQRFQIMRGYSG